MYIIAKLLVKNYFPGNNWPFASLFCIDVTLFETYDILINTFVKKKLLKNI